ncbi:MAG: phospholipase A [Pseudomonadota bacterium]
MSILHVIIVIIALVLGEASTVQAADSLVNMIVLPQQELQVGQLIESRIYFHNEGEEDIDFTVPHRVDIFFVAPNIPTRQVSAILVGDDEKVRLPKSGFVKRQYTFTVPLELQGTFSFHLAGSPATGGMVVFQKAESKKCDDQTTSPIVVTQQEKYPVVESFVPLYQSYEGNFSSHQPIYFLVGTDPEKSKFQISFKYRPFNPNSPLGRDYPWLSGIQLGYTQTSFWDLNAKSLPFDDTSYKPHLYYQTHNISGRPSWMDGLFLEMGFEHESNGKKGDESRGTNTLYLKPIAIIYDEVSEFGMSFSPSIKYYFHTEDNNSDLAEYRGYFELETVVGKAHGLMLSTALQFAEKGVSLQTDLTYPLHRLFNDSLDLFLLVQYTNELAESLIDYREREETLRIGFSLTR